VVRVLGKGDKGRVVALSFNAQQALHRLLKCSNLEGSPVSPHVWSCTSGPRKGEPFSQRAAEASRLVDGANKPLGHRTLGVMRWYVPSLIVGTGRKGGVLALVT